MRNHVNSLFVVQSEGAGTRDDKNYYEQYHNYNDSYLMVVKHLEKGFGVVYMRLKMKYLKRQ